MAVAPLMLSSWDKELLGVANRTDAMGILAVWTARARDIVPHLTEQTTDIRGFQILLEGIRLWEMFEREHPDHVGEAANFFVLMEQTVARIIGRRDQDWRLPGTRRVRARVSDAPFISLEDRSWHLLDGQRVNGIWGLYRGAARRAELLDESLTALSAETRSEAYKHPGLTDASLGGFLDLARRAMLGETVALPPARSVLCEDFYAMFDSVPLRDHLQERLVGAHPLTRALAERLAVADNWDHRAVIEGVARDLEQHERTLKNVIRCENLLAVVVAVFLGLCASKGEKVEKAVAGLKVDLTELEAARVAFGRSGTYGAGVAATRQARIHRELRTSSRLALARSVLALHKQVSNERGRAIWAWDEQETLRSDIVAERPNDDELVAGQAWRNDYYLRPLGSIVKQLRKLGA